MNFKLCLLALSASLFSAPAMAQREAGGWFIAKGMFTRTSCAMTNFAEANGVTKAITIAYDGATEEVQVWGGSSDWVDIGDERGIFRVSFPSLGTLYRGEGYTSSMDKAGQGALIVKLDNPLVLNDIARDSFIRVANETGDRAVQIPLVGSAKAIAALRQCVIRQLDR